MKAMSVLGPVDPALLGFTQPHEHLLCDLHKVVIHTVDGLLNDEALAAEELLFFKRRPGEDFGTFLGKVYYSAFYDLTEGQQRDTKNAAATTVAIGPVDMAGVQNDQDHLLEVWINSPVVVDTTQAASRFEITDVIEQN